MALSRVSSDARLYTFNERGRVKKLFRVPEFLHFIPLVVTFTILLTATSRPSAQVTIYENDEAPPGGVGMSWGSARNDLETALGIAVTGDQIWVASGTYRSSAEVVPGNTQSVTFQLLNGVAIGGEFSGTGTSPSQRDLENPSQLIRIGDFGWVSAWNRCATKKTEWPDKVRYHNLACLDGYTDFVRI